MAPNPVYYRRFHFDGVSYGPYTTAFNTVVLSRGGTLTSTELTYLTTFETGNSNLTELDRLWIHGLSNQIAARTSFVNPSSTAISEVNSPTWTAYQGYTGNGINMYLDTNYNPTNDAVKYAVNSASFGTYNRLNLAEDFPTIGAAEFDLSVLSQLYPRSSIDEIYVRVNQATPLLVATNTDSRGLVVSERIDANTIRADKNGVNIGSSVKGSSALNNFINR